MLYTNISYENILYPNVLNTNISSINISNRNILKLWNMIITFRKSNSKNMKIYTNFQVFLSYYAHCDISFMIIDHTIKYKSYFSSFFAIIYIATKKIDSKIFQNV